jgi:tetratricopeptide (TPR) repeat protein
MGFDFGQDRNREKAIRLTNEAFHDVERRDLRSAKRKLEQALKLAELPDTHNELAVVSARLGDRQAARRHLDRAIELSPDKPKFWSGLSGWYLEEKDYDKALECILVAESLEPGYPPIQLAKMRIAEAKGATADEVEEYRERARELYQRRGKRVNETPLPEGFVDTVVSLDSSRGEAVGEARLHGGGASPSSKGSRLPWRRSRS